MSIASNYNLFKNIKEEIAFKKISVVSTIFTVIMALFFSNIFFSEDLFAQELKDRYSIIALSIDEPVAFLDDNMIMLREGDPSTVPRLTDGQVFVHVRIFEELFQGNVSLAGQTLRVSSRDNEMIYTLNDNSVILNNHKFQGVGPKVFGNTTYVPLRQTLELVGANIYYSNGIILISPKTGDFTEGNIKKYIIKFAQASLAERYEKNSLNRWQLASFLVNKIADFHKVAIKNIGVATFKDQDLIPKDGRKQSQYAIAWQLLNLDKEELFQPFKKIDSIELGLAIQRLEQLLENKPNEYQEISLDNNSSYKFKQDLSQILTRLSQNSDFNYRVAIYDFATDTRVDINGDKTFYPACMIKTLYLLAFLEQVDNNVLSLNKVHTLSQKDKYVSGTRVGGSGNLQYQQNGSKYSYSQLLSLMITISDNLAANIILYAIGLDQINQRSKAYDLNNTRINRRFYEVNSPLSPNATSANDLNKVLVLLENRHLSDQRSQYGIDLMKKSVNQRRIRRYLSKDIIVASKTGTVANVAGEVGLVYYPYREPIALSIILQRKSSKGFSIPQVETEIAKLSQEITNYFNKFKNPQLFINGEKVRENVELRYVKGNPFINIGNIDKLANLDKNKVLLIRNKKYYSLSEIKKQMGYYYDIVDNQMIHLYSSY